MLTVLLPAIALCLGTIIGWTLGYLRGRAELRAFKAGIELERNRGGQCWVRSQLPPHADP